MHTISNHCKIEILCSSCTFYNFSMCSLETKDDLQTMLMCWRSWTDSSRRGHLIDHSH